ncbi:MAG: helix-turn-helix transcriptional regulator, partial [Bullifex sp.]|nr:helix-turn-helix transcriptional regulator [Bullifex sp.]
SEYLQKRRIECARRLLEVTCLQLTDIYEFLGYSSLSHFIKLFRKYEGMTPGEYRSRYGSSGLTSLTE